ncbi:MAG: hypothetical protein K5869_10150 [Saccharofermentans sp.]|nr:hypothetical protein [Saccharofermentans sp.]
MKRFGLVLSVILCLGILCSCSSRLRSQTIPTQKAETTEATVAPPATTKEPTPTPTPAPKVTVTDQLRKTYKASRINYVYKIPAVSIEGMDMTAVNSKIKNDVIQTQKKNKKGMPKNIKNFGTTYSYFNDGRVLSICIASYRKPDDLAYLPVYNVYNISLRTGKLLTPAEFMEMQGLTDTEFFTLLKNNKISTVKSMNYSYVRPFLSKTGKLCIVTTAKNGRQYCYYSSSGDMCFIALEMA